MIKEVKIKKSSVIKKSTQQKITGGVWCACAACGLCGTKFPDAWAENGSYERRFNPLPQ